ncbi:hypothetical protein WK24_29940 [Burkholderia vietnamiensis]|nr:hypothetical protein WK24_29940 [Burkholderia vietnamiensis]
MSYWPRDRSPCARFSRPSIAGEAGAVAAAVRAGGVGRGLTCGAAAMAAGSDGAGALSCKFANGDVCCAFTDAGGAFDAGGVAGTATGAAFVTTAGVEAGAVALAASAAALIAAALIGADAGTSVEAVAPTALAASEPDAARPEAASAVTAGTADAAAGSGADGVLAWRPCHQNAPPAQATTSATPAAMILGVADVSRFLGAAGGTGCGAAPDAGRSGCADAGSTIVSSTTETGGSDSPACATAVSGTSAADAGGTSTSGTSRDTS